MFKSLFTAIILAVSAAAALGQTSEQVLAIAAGQRILVKDLPAPVQTEYENLAATMAERRKELLEVQIIDTLAETESAARKVSFEKLYDIEVKSKVPDPTEMQIQELYDANRLVLENRPLAEVREQIVMFLRNEPEQKKFLEFVSALKAKYRTSAGKNVNAASLVPADILATINGKPITAAMFEEKNKVALFEAKAKVYDRLRFELNRQILSALVTVEAKTLAIEPYQLLAREITDKLRDFSDEERGELESALRRRLFAKYKPQFMYAEPTPLSFAIATEGSPTVGNAAAAVTVVMFSDFQCSACAAQHPVLKKVLAEYGSKVRLVVRNFPLTTIHKDALNAARAARAAATQGKFFEYTEVLYRNQRALDLASLKKYAVAVGLNPEKFELDFQSEKAAAEVNKDIADGRKLGINGTPSIYVNGVRVRFLSADGYRDAIDRALLK